MTDLSSRDRALVGLGAALGSNCIPCAEHHVALARSAGLNDDEIRAALDLADSIRQVPARRALTRATELVSAPAPMSEPPPRCGVPDRQPVEQTLDAMTSTMQRMMAGCGTGAPSCAAGARSKPSSGCC